MFVCCHPALPKDAQVVRALKVLCRFSTAEIARAFLSTEPAIEKQLTRTKQRIRDSNIAFEIPAGPELPERIEGVLAALYLYLAKRLERISEGIPQPGKAAGGRLSVTSRPRAPWSLRRNASRS
jgi:predicted RNA polymerase sigma factor